MLLLTATSDGASVAVEKTRVSPPVKFAASSADMFSKTKVVINYLPLIPVRMSDVRALPRECENAPFAARQPTFRADPTDNSLVSLT